MLTRQQALSEFDFQQRRVVPDRLSRSRHAQYERLAERMLDVYRRGAGRTRRELHRDVAGVFTLEPDCPARRIDAFCKLLDDASTYDRDRGGKAAALRKRVFSLAAQRHPLVAEIDGLFDSAEAKVKAEIAGEIGLPWERIDAALFADVMEFHRLREFPGFADAAALLARYNVAQVQAALFDAESLTVWADEDFKTILRYAKLARLMHAIHRTGEGKYRFRFDGPASVLRATRRYGAAMARFLPALIACRGWRMHAVIRMRRGGYTLSLDLSANSGLSSHLPPPAEFDSNVEQKFAQRWGEEPREGWRLVREAEVLHAGQKVFVPDFALRHEDGRSALLEIVGFWTPEYLAAKLKTVAAFPDERILLAVGEVKHRDESALPPGCIRYKSAPKVKEVLEAIRLR